MKLAIGILTFNHPDISLRCVQSVDQWFKAQPVEGLSRTWIQSIEIFILHNGSFHKNSETLINNSAQINLNIIHHYLKTNLGYSGGANECLRIAFEQMKADWFLFLTNDTEIQKIDLSLFDELYRPHSHRPSSHVVIPTIMGRNGNKIDSIGGCFNPQKGQLSHLKKDDQLISKHEFLYVPGSAHLVHRSVFELKVLFNEKLHTYWEDVDWSMRLVKEKFQIIITDKIILNHKIGKTCHKKSFYTLFLYQRNRLLISTKYTNSLFSTYLFILISWLQLTLKLLKSKRYKDLMFLNSIKYFISSNREKFFENKGANL